MLRIYTIASILLLYSCANTNNSPNESAQATETKSKDTLSSKETFPVRELLVIKSEEQGWGADIRLSYTESFPSDKGITYKVKSLYKNKLIGFEITVPNPGFAKLAMKTIGTYSDNFIHTLSKLYNQKNDTTLKFTDFIVADCVNMGDYIDSLNKQSNNNYVSPKSQYKLFLKGKDEDDYAELFFNINKTEHWIELEEKDEEYRPIIVKLLTRK